MNLCTCLSVIHICACPVDTAGAAVDRCAMTTTDETTTVRLTGRSGLLAAVPSMLGFHPQESLVMVCLSGPRRRVGPVIRVDLAGPAAASDQPITQLQQYAHRHCDEVAVICYTEDATQPKLLVRVLAALEANGTTVLDALLVRGGRAIPADSGAEWSGVRKPGDVGCDVPTADHPQAQAMAAAAALHGRGILPSRQALRESISGPAGRAARQSSAALHAAAAGLMATIGPTGPVDHEKLSEMARAAVDRALTEVAGGAGICPSTCASIAILLCDNQIRDAVIARAVQDRRSPWVPMLVAVARATPDEDAAQVCAVLSVAAYRSGDGALAQVAVDRCLSAEPDHRLAQLMVGVMAAGLAPAELAELALPNAVSPGTAE